MTLSIYILSTLFVIYNSIIFINANNTKILDDENATKNGTLAVDYWMSVHPCDFEQSVGSGRWINYFNNYLYRKSGQSNYVQAHVVLADGVEVKSVECEAYDNDSSELITVALYRKTRTGSWSCGADYTRDSSTYQFVSFNNTCTSNDIINNEPGDSYNTYYIMLYSNGTNNNPRLYNCAIKYNI